MKTLFSGNGFQLLPGLRLPEIFAPRSMALDPVPVSQGSRFHWTVSKVCSEISEEALESGRLSF